MPDHQTSPVGEDAERAAFEVWYRTRYSIPAGMALIFPDVPKCWEVWQAARRTAPALDASGLPPAEPLCTMRSAFEAIDFVAESKMPNAAHWATGKLKRVEVAAPTQPKAQVVASIDTPEFQDLLQNLVSDAITGKTVSYMAGRAALIDYIDAWAGGRAGEPVGVIVANDPVHGWHMNALKPWNEIGAGTILYAPAPGKQAGKEE